MGKEIICYDGTCFSTHSLDEINKTIVSSSSHEPINPHTKKPFPNDFVQKMRKRYSKPDFPPISNSERNNTDFEDIPRPSVLNFRRKNYEMVDDVNPEPDDEGEDIEDIDENSDRESEESDEESEEEIESEEEEEEEVYVKVDIGPIRLGEINRSIVEGNVNVIYFYNDWSAFCKILDKAWDKLVSEKTPKVTYIKVNTDYSDEIIDAYDIKVIPSFMVVEKEGTTIQMIDVLFGSRIKELKSVISKQLLKINQSKNIE